ncbi:MAG TPA: hypothetical protein VFQ75_11950, partial [Candidatus Limnocylindrales bacterium]|nr:hypothetical protein [Candidatus Limnocylindrales bacterium]
MRTTAHRPPRPASAVIVLLVGVALVAAACDTTPSPTPSVAATPAITPSGPSATPGSTPAAPAASPSAAPSPSAATRSGDLVPGTLAVTVSDSVRVRSAPRVADDSVKFTPVLPVGTSLVVTAGPV